MTRLTLAGLALLALCAIASAVIVVDDSADNADGNGLCSLREAIENANTPGSHSDCDDPAAGEQPVLIELPSFLEAGNLPATLVDIDFQPSGASTVVQGITYSASHGIFEIGTNSRVRFSGDIVVENGNTVTERTGGAFTVNFNATLLLVDTVVRNNRADVDEYSACAGGVFVENGGGFEAFGATFEFNYGHSRNNETSSSHWYYRTRPFREFSGVPDSFCAGGVWLGQDAAELIETSTFAFNEGDNGGGIFSHGSLELFACQFVNNTAQFGDGGGAATWGDLVLHGSGVEILTGNSALLNGGALFALRDMHVRYIGSIAGNTANENGGALYADGDVILRHIDGDISHNRAQDNGGAVYAVETLSAEHINGRMFANRASEGGVFNGYEGVVLQHVVGDIEHNLAGYGGFIYSDSGDVLIRNVEGNIRYNVGEYESAIVYSDEVLVVKNVVGEIAHNYAAECGGFYADDEILFQDVVGDFYENSDSGSSAGGLVYSDSASVTVRNWVGDFRDNYPSYGIFYASTSVTIDGIRGNIVGNVNGDSGATFVRGGDDVRLLHIDGVIDNNVGLTDAPFAYAGAHMVVRNITGGITNNVADMGDSSTSEGALFYAASSMIIQGIWGDVAHNIVGQSIFYAGGGGLLVSDIEGDVSDNFAEMGFGAIAYADDDLIFRNINGSIVRNTVESHAGLIYANGEVLIENIFGDIRGNVWQEPYTSNGLFYSEYALQMRNIWGDITDNIAGGGLVVADGPIVVDNIGSIAGNRLVSSGMGLFYSESSLGVVNVRGPIIENSAVVDGYLFYGYEGIAIQSVQGGIDHNEICPGFEHCSIGYSDNGPILVERINGSISHNQGGWGGLFYSSSHVVVSDIGGGIFENLAHGPLVYSYSGVTIRDINGGITHNTALRAGLVYGQGESGVEVININGPISYNTVLDTGALFYADGQTRVVNIAGEISYNVGMSGFAYADDAACQIINVHGDIHHNDVFYGNAAGAGGLCYSDDDVLIRDIYGSIHHHYSRFDSHSLFYGEESVQVFNVHGDIYENSVDSESGTYGGLIVGNEVYIKRVGDIYANSGGQSGGGLLYSTDGPIVIENVLGLHDNIANDGAVVYGELGVYIRNVNSSLTGNIGYDGLAYTNGHDGVIIKDINGSINNNQGLDDNGAVVYSDNAIHIYNVNGGIFDNHSPHGFAYSYEDIEIYSINGGIQRNIGTDDSYGSVAYSETQSVFIDNINGDISDNIGSGFTFGAGSSSLIISNVQGGIYNNVNTDWSFAYQGAGSVLLRDIHGAISDNVGGYGLVYAEGNDAIIENIDGGIFENVALTDGGFVVYAEGGVVVKEINGGIHDNVGGTSVFYADDELLVEDIHGGIYDNTVRNDGSSILYASSSMKVAKVHGDIRHNSAGASFAYADLGIEIEDVFGEIAYNVAVAAGAGVAYSDSESVFVNNIHGSIHGNRGANAAGTFYAAKALKISNVDGGLYDNGCTETGEGAVARGSEVAIKNINGSIYDNFCAHGGVASGLESVYIENIAGGIFGNLAEIGGGGVAYGNDVFIRNVDGDINDNTANTGGGVVYARWTVTIEDIHGDIWENRAFHDGSFGGVVYSQSDFAVIRRVGALFRNEASFGGVAYSSDSVVISDVGRIEQNYAFSSGGVAYGVSDTVSISRVGGSIAENHADDHCGVACGGSGVVINDVDGDVVGNEALSGSGGVAYGSTVAVYDVRGEVVHNTAGENGGVLYGSSAVELHDIAGDIAANDASGHGGVIFNFGGHSRIHDIVGWIVDNHADFGSGGVMATGSGEIFNIDGSISGNSAGSEDAPDVTNGGVIFGNGGAILIHNINGDIEANHAKYGGVLYLGSGHDAQIDSIAGDITLNFAAATGGVIFSEGDAHIREIAGFISSNAAHTGAGGVMYCDSDCMIVEAAGICSNEARTYGGVTYSNGGSIGIYGKSTKLTLNEAKEFEGGVAFARNVNNDTSVEVDVGGGIVFENRDAVSGLSDPFSTVGNKTRLTLYTNGQVYSGGDVHIRIHPTGFVANEFMTPPPVVNVTTFTSGVELDFVLVVEPVGHAPYFYPHPLEVDIRPDHQYAFPNITLPSGDYRLLFQIVDGCGTGNSLADSGYSDVFSVDSCVDPRPVQCPTEVIVVPSDAFTCSAYVEVDDISTSPDCDSVVFSNDYNDVQVGWNERASGSASDVYEVGATDVNLLVDTAGDSFTCPVRVVVEDRDEFVSFTCPHPINVDTEAGTCQATVDVPLPVVVDNCPVTIVNSHSGAGAASGIYLSGTTEVTYTGSNQGPGGQCTTEVTVSDHEDPVITCPVDFETTCLENDVFFQVLATDNCADVSIAPDGHTVSTLGGVLPPGQTLLTYVATDAAGNTASCSFVTTVQSVYYFDADGDGFGDPDVSSVFACDPPAGWVTDNTDCNDFNADAWKLFYVDFDGDGFGDPAYPICTDADGSFPSEFLNRRREIFLAHGVPMNNTTNSTTEPTTPVFTGPFAVPGHLTDVTSMDCDDSNPFVHPAAPEVCDGIDNNCNSLVDDGLDCSVPAPVEVLVPIPNPIPVPVQNPVPVPNPVVVPVYVFVPDATTVSSASIMVQSVLATLACLFAALLM